MDKFYLFDYKDILPDIMWNYRYVISESLTISGKAIEPAPYSRGLCLKLMLHGKDSDVSGFRHGLLHPWVAAGEPVVTVKHFLKAAWEKSTFALDYEDIECIATHQ